MKRALLKIYLIFFIFFATVGLCESATLSQPLVRISEGQISITVTVNPPAQFIDEIRQGMTKEIVYYIDLFRIWKIWPDEFVKGRKIVRTIKVNNIKREYLVLSHEGNLIREKRFADVDTMLQWAFSLKDLYLDGISGLDSGKYYVKVSLDAVKKDIPPLVGLLLFFISDKEFSLSSSSEVFTISEK
ncbi:MAG: DUF4390 domain-containing protein [Thermodesulfovibrionales bacterium]|nr:DUF4390 domain-containing protein [Thermodesulfovibrionales bacterium]